MICPQDRTPLIPHQRDGVEARSCVLCHGLWFSRTALEALASKSPQPPTAAPPVPSSATSFISRRLSCPVCTGLQLQTRMQGDLEGSRCRDCGGIWLAKSEVAKILTAQKARPRAQGPLAGTTAAVSAGAGGDLADGLSDAAPAVALEAGSEAGAAVGDFLVSFLG